MVLIAIVLLTGCATWHMKTVPEKNYQDATIAIKEKRYSDATAACRKILSDDPKSAQAADALFELALLHAHYDNPKRDYALAIQIFDQFIKRYPDSIRIPEAQTMVSILKTIQELKKENATLSENIEQLKRLDIKHEQRRKGI
jgi:outer membrane protein assembly factor BamD (BamD/ComL family)